MPSLFPPCCPPSLQGTTPCPCALPPAEYCSRGSLYDCLATAREHATTAAHLTWRRRLAMAVDAGAGLLYLHSLSIIHRDGAGLHLPVGSLQLPRRGSRLQSDAPLNKCCHRFPCRSQEPEHAS